MQLFLFTNLETNQWDVTLLRAKKEEAIEICSLILQKLMFSESESVNQAYQFPQEGTGGCEQTGRNLTFSPHMALKPPTAAGDSLYFKLRVLRHVGTVVQNFKSSIALLTHGLSQKQLGYLQGFVGQGQQQRLIGFDNWLLISIQSLLWLFLVAFVWKNSFELVLGINLITGCAYLPYLALFFNSEHKNLNYELVTRRTDIAKYYVAKRMPCHLLIAATILLQELFTLQESALVFYSARLLGLLAILEVQHLKKTISNSVPLLDTSSQSLAMVGTLLGQVIVFLHCASLLLNLMRKLEIATGQHHTWVEANNLNARNGLELYLLGWYWASTILSTVGFGDISPCNNTQRFLISFLEVFCALIFGYFVSVMGSLLKVRAEMTEKFEQQLRRLSDFLSKTQVPKQLKQEIRSHCMHQEELEKACSPYEDQVLSSLTPQLRESVLESTNTQLISKTTLQNIVSHQLAKQVAVLMKKVTLASEQTLYSKDEQADKFWLVEKGSLVERWNPSNGAGSKDVAVYNSDYHFNIVGWINFVKEQVHCLSTKATQFTILHSVDRQSFMKVIKQSARSFEKIMEQRDRLTLGKKNYEWRCECCSRMTHSTVECPKIHFNKRAASFIEARQNSKIQKTRQRRKKCERSEGRFSWKSACLQLPVSSQMAPTELLIFGSHTSHRKFEEVALTKTDKEKKQRKFRYRPSLESSLQYPIGKKLSMKLLERDQYQMQKDQLRVSNRGENEMTSSDELSKIHQENSIYDFDRYLANSSAYFEQHQLDQVIASNNIWRQKKLHNGDRCKARQ